jgi:hypothetical protein
MLVQLNCRLMEDLIEKQGGVKAFLDRWHSRSPSADERLSRATVYRWIGGESGPKNVRLLLRLAGLLDVDPFALLDVPDGDTLAAADEVLRFVQNASTPTPWLQFVHSFFGRQISWPPEDVSAVYFGRPWLVREFTHDPATRANYYATVLLRPALQAVDHPQVIHFAYKHPFLFGARWLQYGLILVRGVSVALHDISGYSDRLSLSTLDDPVAVETWFGPGPALFRVASLHPFANTLASPEDATRKAVRFPG